MRKLIGLGIVAALLGLAAFWIITIPARVDTSALLPHAPDLTNGRAMFYAGGCAACHATPKSEDRTRLGGGLPVPSPFGTFYVPNISSHADDGIGRWTEAEFVTALWKGTSPSGTHYFPSFPYTSYRKMALKDVRDLFAFLKTLPPIAGKARAHDVPFPFNIRRSLGGWKFLFFADAPFQPDPGQSPQWNRGAYLVNGPGHCAECHSPRNFIGGIVSAQRFAGGPNPEGEGWVPNITAKGLGSWSLKDLTYFLETGETPEGDSVGGPMARVIANTSQLSAQDREAIAVYLKSLPAVESPPRPAKPKAS